MNTSTRTRTRIKICCISSLEEARIAVAAGVDVLGLVSHMPSGPGVISEEEIAAIASRVPPGVATFLLSSRRNADEILAQVQRCRAETVQLCDRVDAAEHARLREMAPTVRRVQVVHVVGAVSIDEAVEAARYADAILLDSGEPDSAAKSLGGTGRTHDWGISRSIRERIDRPIFLAGGLHAGNVGEAIERVRPFGVDICSGVRSDGRLDPRRVEALVEAVRTADARLR